jgi:hypothetical protein
MNRTRAVLAKLCVLTPFVIAAPVASQASTIEIQFTGLDLQMNPAGDADSDLEIYDAASAIGGNGIPVRADPLTTVSFFQDGSLVGTLSSDIFADVWIDDIGILLSGGNVVTTGGNGNTFGFDILTSNSTPGWGLALNVDEFQIFYTGFEIAIVGTGLATSVPAQSLPFGLVVDPNEQISIVFSSTNLTNVMTRFRNSVRRFRYGQYQRNPGAGTFVDRDGFVCRCGSGSGRAARARPQVSQLH